MNKKAFTLIELMLVVIIIGVLAAMVMPRLVGRSEQARIAAAKADINANIALALDLYEMDNGVYPDSLSQLLQKSQNGKGPYLKRAPKDPWGNDYAYARIDSENYTLCSSGPGTSGSADGKICNDSVSK
ncbi:MAG: type II secretion system major pseudopilin GspG [Candidatus Omnitrophica bacterium]|nr:type II secretion system major pseudopilin GspG [Candidatus Omnitrophota bacterium]